MKCFSTVATVMSLLSLSSACMVTHILYDVPTETAISGVIYDNGVKHCNLNFEKVPLSQPGTATFSCETGDWNAQLNYDGNNFAMEISPGGYRDVIGFGLQKSCMNQHAELVPYDGPDGGCRIMQLTAYEFGCTKEQRWHEATWAQKVGKRFVASW